MIRQKRKRISQDVQSHSLLIRNQLFQQKPLNINFLQKKSQIYTKYKHKKSQVISFERLLPNVLTSKDGSQKFNLSKLLQPYKKGQRYQKTTLQPKTKKFPQIQKLSQLSSNEQKYQKQINQLSSNLSVKRAQKNIILKEQFKASNDNIDIKDKIKENQRNKQNISNNQIANQVIHQWLKKRCQNVITINKKHKIKHIQQISKQKRSRSNLFQTSNSFLINTSFNKGFLFKKSLELSQSSQNYLLNSTKQNFRLRFSQIQDVKELNPWENNDIQFQSHQIWFK